MRILEFIVDGQTIKQDPECDFTNLVPGSEGYLQAKFSFSSDWDGCIKVVAFYSPLGREYPPQAIGNSGICTIPPEALKKRAFKVQVLAKKKGVKLVTNRLTITQDGGRA
jgi:hypothetical protein